MDTKDSKPAAIHLEEVPYVKPGFNNVVGTVKLIDCDEIVLVPTPTTDPTDPLNLPKRRKWALLIVVSIFASTGTLIASGVGAVLPVMQEDYGQTPKINDLVTYPSLFMGLGNVIAVPVSHAVGRRPVYLVSNLIFVLACVWAAYSKSLNSHIAARDVVSLAAGQAEALCPIIVQECHYLHERGNRISWFCALQTLGTAVLIMSSSYLASSARWRWWYLVFAIVNAAALLLAVVLVSETKYPRSVAAQVGEGVIEVSPEEGGMIRRVTTSTHPGADVDTYGTSTFLQRLKPFQARIEWNKALACWKQMVWIIWLPNILWLVTVSGAFLSAYVVISGTFSAILVQPPYDWSYDWLGFVFAGQAVVSLVVVPLSGYGGDYIVRMLSRRNGGVAEPEYRLLPLVVPFVVAIVSTIIYGEAGTHPDRWDWSAVAVSMNAVYFGFVSVVVGSFTYCIDSYPQRSDAALVILCAARGVIGFAISYGATNSITKGDYTTAMRACAIIFGLLAVAGIFVFVLGKRIRRFSQPWVADGEQEHDH